MKYITINDANIYIGEFKADELGQHRIELVGASTSIGPVSAKSSVLVSDINREFYSAAQNSDLLKRIAAETGGKYYQLGDTQSLLDDLTYRRTPYSESVTKDLWDMPINFILIIGMLCAEWFFAEARRIGVSAAREAGGRIETESKFLRCRSSNSMSAKMKRLSPVSRAEFLLWRASLGLTPQALCCRQLRWLSALILPVLLVSIFVSPAFGQDPLIYFVEPGFLELSDEQAARLREYVARGGFLFFDDFWGVYEIDNLETQLRKIWPDCKPKDLPLSHPIFHSYLDVDEILQVPNFFNALRGQTSEKGGTVPHRMGVEDKNGRLVCFISFNTDMGDAWEWINDPRYPVKYGLHAYKMAINVVIYAMSH